MWPGAAWLRGMANRALAQRAWSSLQSDKLDGIVGLGTGCDGVCAVVAALTIETAMPGGKAIERLVLCVTTAVASRVITTWLVKPGIGILLYSSHGSVAIDARHPSLRHHIPQAAGLRARVAIVTPV